MQITFNQITPRRRSGEIGDVKVHFTYSMRFGDEEITGSGALSSEDYLEYIDFDGLTKAVRGRMIESISNGDTGDIEDAN